MDLELSKYREQLMSGHGRKQGFYALQYTVDTSAKNKKKWNAVEVPDPPYNSSFLPQIDQTSPPNLHHHCPKSAAPPWHCPGRTLPPPTGPDATATARTGPRRQHRGQMLLPRRFSRCSTCKSLSLSLWLSLPALSRLILRSFRIFDKWLVEWNRVEDMLALWFSSYFLLYNKH
jgi:hypothetical protein